MKTIDNFLLEITTYQIYCDMDGVLVDFAKKAKETLGMPIEQFDEKYGTSKTWAILSKQGILFWSDMDWKPDGKLLWQFILPYKPIILSKPIRSNACKIGKKIWIHKHLGKDVPYILEPEKEKYADKTSILIDDDIKNAYPWKNAGGISILHKNTKETIGKLKNFLR